MEVPSNSGFGKSVITELVPYELGGTAQFVFSPEGILCRLDIPGEWWAPVAIKKVRANKKCRTAENNPWR
jgi:hypothetical protein